MKRVALLSAAALVLGYGWAAQARGAAPPPEIVEGETTYDDGHGFLRIAGELRNGTSRWLCSPRIEVDLLDADNKPIAVDSIVTLTRTRRGKPGPDGVYAERTWLAPGELAPFVYLRDRRQLGGADPVTHRLRASAKACPATPTHMAIDNATTERSDSGAWTVAGAIRNDGPAGCRSPRAVIGLYRADGKLAQALAIVPDATFRQLLAPGELVRFERRAIRDPVGGSFARVEVWGDCDRPES